MNNFLSKIATTDFLWNVISDCIAGKGVMSRTGYLNIRCPVCHDYKPRCGVKNDGSKIEIKCYNCPRASARWQVGEGLSGRMRNFLAALGVSENEIQRLNWEAYRKRDIIRSSPDAILYIKDFATPQFESHSLPRQAKSMKLLEANACDDPDFLAAKTYIQSRGAELWEKFDFFWSPTTDHEMNRRVIIPFVHEGRTVGYSARAIDQDNTQRYQMIAPPNFLFNSSALTRPRRKFVILTEGVLDAIALDSIGLCGNRLNPEQIAWIKSCGKQPIMLVDRDRQGQVLVDTALAQNWPVAFAVGGTSSWWDPKIKDAAEACKNYGSLWTLQSVLATATTNKMQINLQRKKLTK